jgi:PAS domain S-box-containing protein
VYAHGDQYLGYGVVGGKMNSGLLQGEMAAKMALANLSGTPVSAIPVYREGMTGYMFDENIVRRWNIPLSALPQNSRVINHTESPLEKYGLYLAAIALFVFLETWIIIALLVSRRNRIRVETELRSTDATLRSLISANPETVILIDPSGTIQYCNEVAATRLGSTPDQLLGKDMFMLTPPDVAARRKAMLDEVFRTGKTVRALDPRSNTIFQSTYAPILGPEGRIERVAILAIDITESQHMQEMLARINRKLKNLAEITRTDLANRAFVTQGYVDLLGADIPKEKREEFQKKLRETLDSLVQAITISRQYQDLGDRLPLWQDVNKTFLFAISHVNSLKIQHDLPMEQYEIFADPGLENAFLSLIHQTMAGTRPATRICLRALIESGDLLLIYQDNGSGLPAQERTKFFSPEYPEYRSMFIAREILDVTGISIRETGGSGDGLRFEMRIPAGQFRLSPQPDTSKPSYPGTDENRDQGLS